MENESKNITNSLAHMKWNCKYHIVFAPKYRRKVFFEEKRAEIREILRKLCAWKGVEIIEGEICPDHVHMLVSIPPKMSVSGFMGYLKGKSSLMIFDQFANLKYKYGNRHFWCRGYYVDTVISLFWTPNSRMYDGVGNPCKYRGNVLQWKRGRMLTGYGGNAYRYDDGIRQEKITAEGAVHRYYTSGGRILGEEMGTIQNGQIRGVHFFYRQGKV